jgi:hypothetical protein
MERRRSWFTGMIMADGVRRWWRWTIRTQGWRARGTPTPRASTGRSPPTWSARRRIRSPGGSCSTPVRAPAWSAASSCGPLAHGFRWPPWYLRVKREAAPQLETPERMAAAARAAGLVDVDAHEYAADVGIDRTEDLVAYRFGQAHCRAWLDGLSAAERARVRAAAVAAAAPLMQPYRPRVVRLVARRLPNTVTNP